MADHGGAHGGRVSARGRARRRRAGRPARTGARSGSVLWVVCLNGGTLALNSAFDRDEGDVAYLRRPPAPPRYLAGVQPRPHGRSGSCSPSALAAPYAIAYAVCFVLSLAYSVPPLRLKAVAGRRLDHQHVGLRHADAVSPAGPPPACRSTWRARLVLLAFCPLFAALYPLTQLYQLEEDTRRGDRTLACVLGVRRSLTAALVAAGAGVRPVRGGRGCAPAGGSAGADLARWAGLAVALVAWAVGAGALAARCARTGRRPITSGACTGPSAPGRSPTSSSCWPGAPERPLAGARGRCVYFGTSHLSRRRHALGGGTARGPRPDGCSRHRPRRRSSSGCSSRSSCW